MIDPKTLEQVGNDVYNAAQRVYNCSGSDAYEADKNVYTSNWTLPQEAEQWLRKELAPSKKSFHCVQDYILKIPGMVNFSVLGRNATMGERQLYVKHDTITEERYTIAEFFEKKFTGIQAVVGGDTGIDIYPVGADKSPNTT